MPLIYSSDEPQPRRDQQPPEAPPRARAARARDSWLLRSAKLAIPAVLVAALSAVIFALAEPGGAGSPEAAPATVPAAQPRSGAASASSKTAVSVTVRMDRRRHRWVAQVHKSTGDTEDQPDATISRTTRRSSRSYSTTRVHTIAVPRRAPARRTPTTRHRSPTSATTAPVTTVTVPAARRPGNGRHLGNGNGSPHSAPTPPPAGDTTTTTAPTTRPGASGTAPGH